MSVRDRGLATVVGVLWGLNFLAVRIGLDYFPPFFLAALRFIVLALPVILFVPRPRVAFRWLLSYGLGFGTLQFGLLFLAIRIGMPTGLSSLVIQASAPFTVIMAAILLREQVSPRQAAGVVLATAGIAVLAWGRVQVHSVLPVALTLTAGLGWALGNLASRKAQPDSPLRFALWMSVVPPLPLLALSAGLEGPAADWHSVAHAFSSRGWPGLAAVAYIAVVGTVAGSWIWVGLLKRYPAAVVAPFSMIVPVVGVLGAWAALGERPTLLSLAGGVVVISGVLLTTRRRAGEAQRSGEMTPVPAAGQSSR
jgi:DME family drug/metabolite transporter/O-acetylserine/cysteine efflux transporter